MLKVKRGNSTIIYVPVTDVFEGTPITNLSSAIDVFFMVKKNRDDPDSEAIISKSFVGGVTVDDPITGTIKITLESADLDIDYGQFYYGVQIDYGAGNLIEIEIKDPTKKCADDIFIIANDIVDN